MIAAKVKRTEDPGEIYDAVALDLIDESPFNPRKTFGDLTELKDSISKAGVIHPPLLRPSPTTPGRFELVCGHRRVRACREIGVHSIACVIRNGLDDRTVVELMLVENSTREDVPPLEEAEAYARLHNPAPAGFGLDLEEIADKVGKSVTHIQRRLRLNDLAPVVKDCVSQGFLLANAAAAISRLDSQADQAEVAAAILKASKKQPGDPGFKPATERDVHWLIDRQLREIEAAPFDVNDAKLVPAAGSCAKCPKRTLAQTTLFPLDGETTRDDQDDRCTDGDCWRQKVHAHGLVQLGKTKAKVLSPEEARQFLGEYGHLDNKKAVDLDDHVDHVDRYNSKSKKWKDVVKDKIEPVIVVDGEGEAHLVVPTKDAKKLLPPPKKDEPKASTNAYVHDPIEDEIALATSEALKAAVVARAKKKQDVDLWRSLAVVIARHDYQHDKAAKASKVKTTADAAVLLADVAMECAIRCGDETEAADELLGKAEAKAIAKKAEDEVRAKHASKDDTKEPTPATKKKGAKKR